MSTCQVEMQRGRPCGKPLYDGQKCIFHSEDSDKDADLFNSDLGNLLHRPPGNIHDLTKFVFLEKVTPFPTSLAGKAFFEGAVFLGDTSFLPSEFVSDVSFNEAIFQFDAKFAGTVFHRRADFSGARFNGSVAFGGARFEHDATFHYAQFNGDVFFSYARFHNPGLSDVNRENLRASFSHARFCGKAQFDNVVFDIGFIFDQVICESDCDFSSSQFLRDLLFDSCQFQKKCSFLGVHFQGDAAFADSRFRDVSFKACQMRSGAQVRFDGEKTRDKEFSAFQESGDFRRVIHNDSCFMYFRMVDLKNAYFLETDVSRYHFIDVSWAARPGFFHRFVVWPKRLRDYLEKHQLRRALRDELSLPKDADASDFNLVAQLYRRLQANYTANYQYSEAGDFYIGEQEMVRKAKGIIRRYLYVNYLYKLASLYGESFLRPLFWLSVVLLCFPMWLLYDGVKFTPVVETNYDWSWSPADLLLFRLDYWECFFRNLAVCSISRSALNDSFTSSSQIGVVTLETILVITFATLFVLALRRRFKRKSF
ncbi:MAG: pentapeptide repeat-containing protein [Candidatus Zixiibacteriota bacterium]